MMTVTLLNLATNKTFEKEFDIFEDLRKFLIKCKYSKKVKVISYTGVCREGMEELRRAGV